MISILQMYVKFMAQRHKNRVLICFLKVTVFQIIITIIILKYVIQSKLANYTMKLKVKYAAAVVM